MKGTEKAYGTLAVHLPSSVIAEVDALAAKENRSRSFILGRIIRAELANAPEPSIRYARRPRAKKEAA